MSTATALLDSLVKQGVELRAEGDKLLLRPSERVAEEVKAKLRKHKVEVLTLLIESETLAEAYRRYWSLSEDREPLGAFQAANREIVRLETQAEPHTAWRTLRATATAWHTKTGVCPFCRERGQLHLPPVQPELELRRGVMSLS